MSEGQFNITLLVTSVGNKKKKGILLKLNEIKQQHCKMFR